eukprot:TRINITY_DN14628_c0_g1_i1.p1 TRINITY_DN14628_c0_g1~~TRINITY_DN14628_c0_g1_i1.p1  ORF type:complete len:412 (-),score=104.16 TRINITY_DN14628_c0_g1_i1:312-1547(-)
MGAGASAQECLAAIKAASADEVRSAFSEVSDKDKARIGYALLQAERAAAGGSSSSTKPKPAVGAAETQTAPTAGAGGGGAQSEKHDDIPKEWGWPAEPYEPEDLKEYVKQATKMTKHEEWQEQIALRTVTTAGMMEEKAFGDLMLNKEGTGEAKDDKHHAGIDPKAYKKGRWYRFLNNKGDCNVYVHNYTRDITSTRPDNFTELTDEEKKRLRKLGIYIKELPDHIEKIYDKQKVIPIVYGSQATCEALKAFFVYDSGFHLLDTFSLRRVNAKALEDSRKAIVTAMKEGKILAVYLGDHICDFLEKIAITKNRDTFPIGLFRHGGLDNDVVKNKIYRDEDKEAGGQCVVRKGFRVCLVCMYDSFNYEMSSMRKEELPGKIPDWQHMEEVRVYNDEDKKRILELLRSGEMTL